MTEFTGERVIPGEVNDDLWAEHIARYALAARFAEGKRTLDIGCGAGYGVAEFGLRSQCSVGIDVAADAVSYARAHATGIFLQASATALPFADHSFDLVTAFEVIEHLGDWNALLSEARRVVREDGVFLVSTPNKVYYAESRAEEGPNPFHVHEFEFAEFSAALGRYFSSVTILAQNRTDAMAFSRAGTGDGRESFDSRVDGAAGPADEANFFVAICSARERADGRGFLYVSRASNLLRERELHIKLLQDELALSKKWLDEVIGERKKLVDAHAEQTRHLEEQNLWALRLQDEWRRALERISQVQVELQTEQSAAMELAGAYERKVAELELENRRRAEWALDIERRLSENLAAKSVELSEAVRLLDSAEATVVERTVWARDLQKRVEGLEAQLQMVRRSRWVRAGQAVGLGPRLDTKVDG